MRLLVCCCVVSGAASLVLELVWVRLLGLVFGATHLAIATVLATFMGGLALGSRVGGPRADRMSRPALGYAGCELGIGLCALAVPGLIGALPGLVAPFEGSPLGLGLARFVGAALVLLVPTTLMGATLPFLVRALVPAGQEGRAPARLGLLYGANTAGAVVGSFAAGFGLLGAIGVAATNRVAAVTDLVLFLVVCLAAWRAGGRPAAAVASPPSAPEPAVPLPPRATVLVTVLVSGAIAMALEVLWSRALAIVLGSSIYSFSIILVAYLVGLSAGAAIAARLLAGNRAPATPLAWALALGAFGALVASIELDRMPAAFLTLLEGSASRPESVLRSQTLLALALLLPPTLPMGAVLPLAARALSPRPGAVGADVGRLYGWNTLGAIAGSIAGGFLLPLVGLERGLHACVAAGLVLSVVVFARAPERTRGDRIRLCACIAGLGVVALAMAPRWDLVRFSYGLFRVSIARDLLARKKAWPIPELLYYEDGVATTVSVERWGKTVAIKNNGKVDASNDADMPTQITVGLLPLLVHGPAERVALVGYGSGVTAGAILEGPVGHLDVIELEPRVVEAASRFFDGENHRPLADPRTRLHLDDGRGFLQRGGPAYDVIVSQPSNPWITGVSNLFTREYFEIVRRRLAPGGLFCQWAQLYELHPIRIKAILAAVRAVFPHAYVLAAESLSTDVLLVASDRPFELDRARIAAMMAEPRARAEALRGGLRSADDVLAMLLLGPEDLEAFTAGAPENTDDNAFVELGAPLDLYGWDRTTRVLARIYGDRWPYGRLERAVGGLGQGPERREALVSIARALLDHGRLREAERALERARKVAGAEARLAAVSALVDLLRGRDAPALPLDELEPARVPEGLGEKRAAEIAAEYATVERLARRGAWKEAVELMDGWPADVGRASGPDLALLYAWASWQMVEPEDAVDALAPFDPPRRPEVLYVLGRARFDAGHYRKSIESLERYLRARGR